MWLEYAIPSYDDDLNRKFTKKAALLVHHQKTDLPSSSEEGCVTVSTGGTSLSPPSDMDRLRGGMTSGEPLEPLEVFLRTDSRLVWMISLILHHGPLCSLFGEGEVELSSWCEREKGRWLDKILCAAFSLREGEVELLLVWEKGTGRCYEWNCREALSICV